MHTTTVSRNRPRSIRLWAVVVAMGGGALLLSQTACGQVPNLETAQPTHPIEFALTEQGTTASHTEIVPTSDGNPAQVYMKVTVPGYEKKQPDEVSLLLMADTSAPGVERVNGDAIVDRTWSQSGTGAGLHTYQGTWAEFLVMLPAGTYNVQVLDHLTGYKDTGYKVEVQPSS